MIIVAFDPLEAVEGFVKLMTNDGLIQNICSVIGFAYVMKLTLCDKHLTMLLAKGLSRIRSVLIHGATIITYLMNIFLTSVVLVLFVWTKRFNVPMDMLIGSILYFIFTRTSLSLSTKSFFDCLENAYGESMVINCIG